MKKLMTLSAAALIAFAGCTTMNKSKCDTAKCPPAKCEKAGKCPLKSDKCPMKKKSS
jgi:hypothetical protein